MIYLGPAGSQKSTKETMKDTARVLDRDGCRSWNSGLWTGNVAVLADLMTMIEYSNKLMGYVSFTSLGDARTTMGNSLLAGVANMGMDYRSMLPKNLQLDQELIDRAQEITSQTGAKITITDGLDGGIEGCDYLCTEVSVSMREAEEVWKDRIELLKPFQVNSDTMEMTGNPNVKYMRCLLAFLNRKIVISEIFNQKLCRGFGGFGRGV